MEDFQRFLIRKGVEKASIWAIKEAIKADVTLSDETKEFWIAFLNGVSITRDIVDIVKILTS